MFKSVALRVWASPRYPNGTARSGSPRNVSLLPDPAQASSAAETPPDVREHDLTSGAVSHSAHRLVCVVPRREILAPSIGGNGTADDFAMVRRLELQTDLAALLAMRRRLISLDQ